jgi:alpha-L-arabinofuranosidase
MGLSTDGILFWGIAIPEDDENGDAIKLPWVSEDEDNYDDFDDWLCKENNIEGDYEIRSAFVKSFPVELVQHCSLDYPMYALAVRGTVTTAYRGSVEDITLYQPTTKQVTDLVTFLQKYHLPCDLAKMGWKLVSNMG